MGCGEFPPSAYGRLAIAVAASLAFAQPGSAAEGTAAGETVEQSLCRMIDTASRAEQLPASFFTRLIWQESSFRPNVTSRAGAQGIAQFMPGTARERGLVDPFDPEQAIPAAARFISDLRKQFGNLGLAAAAYNGGPGRVTAWLAGRGGLPGETRDYVMLVTRKGAEEWAADRMATNVASADPAVDDKGCIEITAELKRGRGGTSLLAAGATAPWGVQLAGNFSKELALAAYNRSSSRLGSVIGELQPMIIGMRLRHRGNVPFYRIRLPAPTRVEANTLCNRIQSVGGTCIVLKS